MKSSIVLRCATAAAALTLTLAACGEAQGGAGSPSSDGGADSNPAVESSEAPDSSENSAPSDGGADSDSAGSGAEEADGSAGDSADESTAEESDSATDTLTISLDGEDTELTPDIVRCSGEGDSIHHVVITRQSGLPLVKVTPGEFAMVKTENRGEPEKSSSTTAITAEDGTVSFDEASIGGAVVDGTVTCLQGDDD